MKCQILFSGKNKKNIITLSSSESAPRVVKVKPSTVLPLTILNILKLSKEAISKTLALLPIPYKMAYCHI